jgi:heme A synthase
MAEVQERSLAGLHRFAATTAGFTVLLLMAGALVTSNDAADSVPDWPLAYGKVIPPLVGGIRYEYAHRVVAAIVAVLTATLAIWIARREPQQKIRRLGWLALGLVIAQALLGAARVKFGHPPVVATIHATVAQIFFITTVALAFFTDRWSRGEVPALEDAGTPRIRTLTLCTTLVILVQLVLGAGYRHGAFGILPHLIGFCVVTLFVVWTGRAVKGRFAKVAELRRGVMLLHATFGTQVLLGLGAYWAVSKAISEAQPTAPYVALTVAHVLVGALTLAASVLLTLASYRIIRAGVTVTATGALHAPAANSQSGGSGA